MSRYRHSWHVATLFVPLLLTGCGSLLGGGKPAELYRFGTAPAAASTVAGGVLPATTRTLMLLPVRFAAEIDTDKILAVQGQKALYIKGVRWAVPAPTLFAQSVMSEFAARVPAVAVVDRRTGPAADASLEITIDRFEAQYDGETNVAPFVVIEGRAILSDSTTNRPIGSFRLSATDRATGNSTSAIAAAFDRASSQAVASTVDWAAAKILATPAATPPGATAGVGRQ